MTTTHAGEIPVTSSAPALRGLVPLAVGLFFLATWVGTIVLPYLANDLHTLPLEEVAGGAHDPKDLWPATEGWGTLAQLGALLTLTAGPLLVLVAGGWAVACLVVRRRVLDGRARAVLVSAVVVALTFLVLFFSPFGRGLATWIAD